MLIAIGAGAAMAVAQPAGGLPACPARITTQQSLREPVPGWTAERGDRGHALDGVSFFTGPVAERGELAPASSSASGDRFSFAGLREPVRFVCRYRGTDVTLSRALPPGVKGCVVTSVHGKPANTCR